LTEKSNPVPINVDQGYSMWADSYVAESHNPLMEIEESSVINLLPKVKGKHCLDLACGTGRYMSILEKAGASLVVGTDKSFEMLKASSQDNLIQCAFHPLPFKNGAFDIIVCGLAVGHSSELTKTLAEASRVLKPGGALIYSDFHPFASLLGWQRTFKTDDSTTYALEHYTHLYQDHVQSCKLADLSIETVQEECLRERGQHQYAAVPVVLTILARKITDTNEDKSK